MNLVVKKIIGRVPGKKWYPSFMKRKKVEIKTFRANPLDPKHAKAFNRTNLNSYFDLIEETMHKHKIRWCDVANMDEKGLQLGGGRKLGERRVIGATERKSVQRAKWEFSAPAFIFSGKRFMKNWLEGLTEAQKNVIFPPDPKRPCLLILDGHGSHASALIIRYVWENLRNIVNIICPPPHTTHKLQPLEVGVFGPIGKAWSDVTDDMLEDGHEVSKRNLIKRYLRCRDEGMKASTIGSAWAATGLLVHDHSGREFVSRNHFAEADFAPARQTSSRTPLPDCIPPDLELALTSSPSHSNNNDDSDHPSNPEEPPTIEHGFYLIDPTTCLPYEQAPTPVTLPPAPYIDPNLKPAFQHPVRHNLH
ncbi:hypothetical protein BT69DRAFT_1291697 [Atractiella rhizophila]|nr:hypothetical protein BT69DRAFT_1291697 [Atractiella rhizophila]